MMLLGFRIQQSAIFLAMSLYGYATRSDLSKVGAFLFWASSVSLLPGSWRSLRYDRAQQQEARR
jgi:hypothetical protein